MNHAKLCGLRFRRFIVLFLTMTLLGVGCYAPPTDTSGTEQERLDAALAEHGKTTTEQEFNRLDDGPAAISNLPEETRMRLARQLARAKNAVEARTAGAISQAELRTEWQNLDTFFEDLTGKSFSAWMNSGTTEE